MKLVRVSALRTGLVAGTFTVGTLVTGLVDARAIMQPEGLRQ